MQELFSSADQAVFMGCIERARSIAVESGEAVIAGIQRGMANIDFLPLFAFADGDSFFGEYPGRQQAFLSSGCVANIESCGESRFLDTAKRCDALFANQQLDGFADSADSAEYRPRLLGGFSFWPEAGENTSPWRDFPPAKLVLPELLLSRHGNEQGKRQTRYSLFVRVLADSDSRQLLAAAAKRILHVASRLELPANASARREQQCGNPAPDYDHRYRDAVERLLNEIEQGTIEKAVLARSCRVHCNTAFVAADVLFSLRENHPDCFIFGATLQGEGEGAHGSTFVGASPERLLSLKNNRIFSGPVAGSIKRGVNTEEDEILAQRLLNNKKEHAEHSIVVDGVRRVLAPFCSSLDSLESPGILKLSGIQHLYTRIEGVLANYEGKQNSPSILAILDKLHPTAAVGGAPRSRALAWLKTYENLDRGWYTGPIGWVNDRGEGDFAIALRAALLRDNEARLFAGAGIVAGSTAECELQETQLKMKAALHSILAFQS